MPGTEGRPGAGVSTGSQGSKGLTVAGGLATGCVVALIVVGAFLLYCFIQLINFFNELGKINSGTGAAGVDIILGPGVAKAAVGVLFISCRKVSIK